VITSIALDHQDWLGSDLEAIGREKAGICRTGKPVVCGPEMPESVLSYCDAVEAPLLLQDKDFSLQRQQDGRLLWRSHGQQWSLPNCQLPLVSVAAALQVLQLLPQEITEQHCQSLAGAQLTGRFQCVRYEGVSLILDVAHNPASAQLLASRLAQTHSGGRTLAIVAVMADKDVPGILQPLMTQVDAWMLADLPNSPRALPAVKLGSCLAEQGATMISVSKNVRQAFRRALSMMGENDRLLVFGSFFTVTEALKLLERKAGQGEAKP
jgi:dihydrofolate synthase/folylpolyglutamate synthase